MNSVTLAGTRRTSPKDMIKLIRSTFYKEDETKQKLTDFIMRASQLSMGEQCRIFEESFAKKQGRRFALLVNSGSSANLVLLRALLNLGRIKQNDVVGFSALTWATNVMPIMELSLVPHALDCEVNTLNLSPALLEQALPKLKVLFITNVLGLCDDIQKIRDMCKTAGVILLEDNCEGLGSQTDGTLLGNFGLASTFSFFVGHHLSTIEGGMIVTDDEELHEMMTMVRAHGWDRNLPPEGQDRLRKTHGVDDFFAKYTFYDLAYNVRPTEITGFIGNTQLPYLDEMITIRQANYTRMNAAIVQNSDYRPLAVDHMDTISSFAIPVVCRDEETLAKHKKRFIEHEVEVRPIIAGDMTRQPFYKKYAPKDATPCPNTHLVHTNGFYFGNNPDMPEEELVVLESLLAPEKST